MGPGHAHEPTTLYNGMIAPLVKYTNKGALWYQGETEAGRAQGQVYGDALMTLGTAMFLPRRPSPDTIDRFLRDSRRLPLSYEPVGILNLESTGRNIDELTVPIGRGPADFARARAALIAWKQFDIEWVEAYPPNAPVVAGTVVAILIRHLGFWSLNGCRIVYEAGSPTDGTRFGYAYGTLTNHAEAGEELFEILIDPATEIVSYHIRATSWPRALLAKLGQPIVRALQARFRADSAAAMKQVVASR